MWRWWNHSMSPQNLFGKFRGRLRLGLPPCRRFQDLRFWRLRRSLAFLRIGEWYSRIWYNSILFNILPRLCLHRFNVTCQQELFTVVSFFWRPRQVSLLLCKLGSCLTEVSLVRKVPLELPNKIQIHSNKEFSEFNRIPINTSAAVFNCSSIRLFLSHDSLVLVLLATGEFSDTFKY